MFAKTILRGAALLSLASSISATGILSAYYPGSVENAYIDWNATDVGYFVSVRTTDTGLETLDANATASFSKFVADAKSWGKKAVVSIGGWEGSVYFSSLAKTEESRVSLVKEIVALVNQHKLAGVSLDWNFPGVAYGNNQASPDDTANFLSLLQALRKALGQDAWIAAQVSPYGLFSSDGKTALTDYKDFGDAVDAFNVMAYDYAGNWSASTGPDSPYQKCGTGASIFSDIEHYTVHGFPVSKIVLGISAFSKDWTLKNDTIPAQKPIFGDQIPKPVSYWSRIFNPVEAYIGNQPTYVELKKSGILNATDDYSTGADWKRNYCHCSKTPSLFNAKTQEFIVYIDTAAAATRAQGSAERGFKGVFISRSDGFDSGVYEAIKFQLFNTTLGTPPYNAD